MYTKEDIQMLTTDMELELGSQGPSQHQKNPQPNGTSAPRTTGIYQPSGARQGFDCSPTTTGVNALTSIPRDPVTITAIAAYSDQAAANATFATVPFSVYSNGEAVGLDSVVGMYLCELEVDFQLNLAEVDPATQQEQDAYIDTLMRSGKITLLFRGEQVANLRNMRVGELVWNPECCGTDFGGCVGAILPDYGVLEARVSLPQPPAGIDDAALNISIEANGCGCTCGRKGGCGC